MIKSHSLTATQLRFILSISLFVIALIGGGGFFIVNSKLKDYAVEVSHVTADAEASRNNLQNLQKIQKQLADSQAIVQKASSIVAESQSYQYQDQIITDINNYATKAGVAIIDINFSSGQASATPPAGAAPAPVTPAPSGVKSTSVAITLKNPVNYTNLLTFIKSIEQNLTKMQVSRINLSRDAAGNGVSSDILTLQVYVR